MTYGEKVAALRKARNMTQAELGSQFGVTAQTVSEWETGVAMPDFSTAAKIAKFFGVSLSYFDSDDPDTPAATHSSAPEPLGVCTACGRPIYEGNMGRLSSTPICSDCVKRQELEAETQRLLKEKAKRLEAVKWGKRVRPLTREDAKPARNKGLITAAIISPTLYALTVLLLWIIWPHENIGNS